VAFGDIGSVILSQPNFAGTVVRYVEDIWNYGAVVTASIFFAIS
jgi:hypothetical protein